MRKRKTLKFCEYAIKINIYGTSLNSKTSFNIEYCFDRNPPSQYIECYIPLNKCQVLMYNFGKHISKYILPKELFQLSVKHAFIIQAGNGNEIRIVTDYIRSLDLVLNSLYRYYSKNQHILIEKPYEMVIVVENLKEPKEIISQIVLDAL